MGTESHRERTARLIADLDIAHELLVQAELEFQLAEVRRTRFRSKFAEAKHMIAEALDERPEPDR